MLDKIWRFLKQLIQRVFRTSLQHFNPPLRPLGKRGEEGSNLSSPLSKGGQRGVPPTLTDAEYEAKLMELLEGVNEGWGRGDVADFLLAKRIKDGDLAAWLRRFGARLLEGAHGDTAATDAVVSLQELARRLELLGRVAGGELGECAGNVGREILVEFPLSSVGGDEDVDREAEEWKKRGNEQYEQGNFQEALAFYEGSIELKYNAPEVWEKRGLVLQKLGNYQGAIDSNNTASILYRSSTNHDSASVSKPQESFLIQSDRKSSFNKALEIKLDDDEAWFNRGVTLFNLGKLEEAIASWDKALEFQPDFPLAWNNRGFALGNLGRLEEAIASYDKALEFQPDFHLAWINRGIALGSLGRFEEEIATYDKALEFKPDDRDAWNNRGIALRELGRLEEAIAAYDKALEIKPDYHHTWNSRGNVLCELGRLEEAIAAYDKALEFKPDYHEAWNNRGIKLYNLGRLEDAIASFDKALEIKLDDHEAWNDRGIALYNLGRLEDATASFDKALEIKPDYHVACNNWGTALFDLGRWEDAIASFDKALEIKPDLDDAWFNRGNALGNLDRLEDAIASYDKVLEIRPDDDYAWINRSIAVKNAPGYNQLVYEILQVNFPKSPPVTRTLLTHNLKQRGYEGQILTLEAALEYCRQNTHPEGYGLLHQELGNAHYSRGKLNSSYTYWNKAATSYKEALKTLTKDAFLKLHLEVFQSLIKTLVSLKDTEEANLLQREATDLLQRLLKEQNYSQLTQQQLTDKLVRFEQLTVNIFMQSGQFAEALATAETDKNVCLSWLLNALPIPPYQTEERVTHAQIQQLLNPTTAAIYWHLSDASLTTFIIKSDGLLSPENCLSDFPDKFEEWVKEWNQQYTDYQSKEKKSQQNHPWRAGMPSKFARLKEILKIDDIEQQVEGITDLILIPHRDLHRFPIHALFSRDFVVSYLPSAAVGINLQHRFSGISRLSPSLDPPKSPLRRGTLNESVPPSEDTLNTLVPPFLRGVRGDQSLENPAEISDLPPSLDPPKSPLRRGTWEHLKYAMSINTIQAKARFK
ncbi:tetratricopeptide repeat protein [Microcoleus sp. S28C3]|uniref:tetratricopeptide repeat protein n=1 Tax=Microcoleus sp. S28C3 TaxID=3055414 RepID=UPI002FD43EA7